MNNATKEASISDEADLYCCHVHIIKAIQTIELSTCIETDKYVKSILTLYNCEKWWWWW